MLSRTASELFWMARYLERAESYARVLDVTWKLSMIPRHSQQSRDLALPLNLSLTHELFQARHARFTMSRCGSASTRRALNCASSASEGLANWAPMVFSSG